MGEINRRTIELPAAGLCVRESADGKESRVIEGYALKFGVRSQLLQDWWERYYEILESGCVTRELLDTQDFVLSLYHDPHRVLGRSNNGKGTLTYEVDSVGVKFSCEMPHTADGDEALELVKRGDLDGCSFIYSTDEADSVNCVSYEPIEDEDGEEVLLRHVKKILRIYDFTLTWRPAYKQTECSAREREALEGMKHTTKEEETAREKEAAERRKREVESLRSAASAIFK